MADTAVSCSVDEHLARVLALASPLPPRLLPLADALGLTLAADVAARVDVPGFDNSAMDGYAVRHRDVAAASVAAPVLLRVVADLPAGSAATTPLSPGEAARIMTGAMLPDAADYVVPIEDTLEYARGSLGTAVPGGTVSVTAAPAGRDFIRRAGSDLRAGAVALTAGRALGSRDLAAAASVGQNELLVHPAVRVAVLSTGSELSPLGAELPRGHVHDANSWLLAAAIAELGAVPVLLAPVPDDAERLRAALDEVAGSVDAIVTSGGVSVGAFDVVKAVLAPLPGTWFGAVRMQPGKPQGCGRWHDGTPVFALPGNPVSVFVSFEAFVAPALRTMQGRPEAARAVHPGIAAVGWRSPAGRAQYMPVLASRHADGTLRLRPSAAGGSGSHLIASLADANAVAIVPESATEVRAGERLPVWLLSRPGATPSETGEQPLTHLEL